MTRRPPEHVVRNAIALDAVELVYVPVPRAGSTAILWALAASEGLSREHFATSEKLEVTRALTVHDLTRWGDARLLAARSGRQLDEALGSDSWLRFTVVREPVRRLWSAWVTKILLRDPRFVAAFGSEDWFPRGLSRADEVVQAFRRFVSVLADRPASWHDPHWSAQADLVGVGEVDYRVVGTMERADLGLGAVDEHLHLHGRAPLALERENVSLLPFSAGLLDAATSGACAAFTARDRAAFGYPELEAGAFDDGWAAAVEAALPAVEAVAERNERIDDLRDLLRGSRPS